MDRLNEVMKHEAKKLSDAFSLSSIAGQGTPQEISDFRENALRDFLSRFLPSSHRITKGQIVDSFNNVSASIDCVVVNPAHPYTVDSGGKFVVILADGVDAVIEIKPDISDLRNLEAGLEQLRSVKKLRRQFSESPKEFFLREERI